MFHICCNQSLVIHSDLIKHNVFCKKIKCSINVNNMANVHNLLVVYKNWLKWVVNVDFKTTCSHFIFVTSLPTNCVDCGLDHQTKKLSLHHTIPYQTTRRNISLILSVARLKTEKSLKIHLLRIKLELLERKDIFFDLILCCSFAAF